MTMRKTIMSSTIPDDACFQVLRCRSVTHGLPVEHLEAVIGGKGAELQALVPEEA